ncbi:MAG TPA: hypothetical protein VF809_00840, partial [Candidatus Saccharimonadales bacterium]
VDVFLPKKSADYAIVIGVQTSATSRDSYGRNVTTTAFVPCEGDSQLALRGNGWRPVGDPVELPAIVMADTVS